MTASTGKPRLAIIVALAALQAFAQAETPRANSKPSHPALVTGSMKTLVETFAGSWAIQLTLEGPKRGVDGSAGNGEETWRAGPGSNSLIEDYHSTGTEGEIAGLGIFWREGDQGFKVFWCDNTTPVACRTLHDKVDWTKGRLALTELRYVKGKRHIFQEIFAFDSPDSFTQTLADGNSVDTLRPSLTIRATRKKP